MGRKAMERTSRNPTPKKTTIIKYLIKPVLSPFGPKMWRVNPQIPFERKAQANQRIMKMAAMAKVMFRSEDAGQKIIKPLDHPFPKILRTLRNCLHVTRGDLRKNDDA